MAFTAADGTSVNLLNYMGRFFLQGNLKNPLISSLGARDLANGKSSGFRQVFSMKYPMGQTATLDAASQPSLSETALKSAGTSSVLEMAQTLGYCNPFRADVFLSKIKLNDRAISGRVVQGGAVIFNLMKPQILANFKQIAKNFEYCCHNGALQDGSGSAGTAYKMNGLLTSITTNIEDANVVFSKAVLDALLVTMDGNGADSDNLELHARLILIQKIAATYGLAVRSQDIGGVAVKYVETDSCRIKLVNSPKVPANTIGLYDSNHLELVANYAAPDSAIDVYDLAVIGAGIQAEILGFLGLDFGDEQKHGKITNVTAS